MISSFSGFFSINQLSVRSVFQSKKSIFEKSLFTLLINNLLRTVMVILLNFIPSGFSFNFTYFGVLYIETGSIFLLIGSHGKPCFVLLERQKTKTSELLGNCQCCFSISCSSQPAGCFENILRLERGSVDSVVESLSLPLYLFYFLNGYIPAKSLLIPHFTHILLLTFWSRNFTFKF